ncbi:hypothetical protein B0O80DRAFT_258679 [Mortierella sp. GBAus27b]|nr:hypothetical protein B0O80DRAFT_258679 [Mortierella sp. GBAus27b]
MFLDLWMDGGSRPSIRVLIVPCRPTMDLNDGCAGAISLPTRLYQSAPTTVPTPTTDRMACLLCAPTNWVRLGLDSQAASRIQVYLSSDLGRLRLKSFLDGVQAKLVMKGQTALRSRQFGRPRRPTTRIVNCNGSQTLFQLYGRYILTILRMIKYRISMTGVHVPPVSDLVPAGTVDQLGTSLEALKDTIELGIDQVNGCLESVDTNDGEDGDGITGTTGYNEALRRVDLGNLSMFLKRKDDGTALGNLIRTAATDKGIVKWVCQDHYRESALNRQRTATETLGRFASLREKQGGRKGLFGNRVGR